MSVFNCKMCGGSLEITEGQLVCKCEYCGTEQTLPKAENEQIINLLNRANHFRQLFDFDKAMEMYEKVLERESDDAEIYWSLVLCRYGIEYVDDPVTHAKIATCHRTQYKSILEDADYLEALKRADVIQRGIYEREADYIDKVQKGILEISNKEAAFDVFICYKESDESGSRTIDSALAQDIYYELTEEGFKVFFSRITLESKLGRQYEPYIFAALNSAKVMLVVGTKPEYFNAVWVKNEWSRYLSIMQNQENRLIIPVYRDMDPYDLPDALSYYQAQDMSKIGFIQDLIRGIKKILEDKTVVAEKEDRVQNESGSNLVALLKRGDMALEDGEWDKAFGHFDEALNIDAECAQAYWGQSKASHKAANSEEFKNMRLALYESVDKTEHTKSIEEDILEKSKNILQESPISDAQKGKIMQALQTPVAYETELECRTQQLEQEQNFFKTDKLLSKAFRFSKDKELDLLNNVMEEIFAALENRKMEAQQHDAEEERRVDDELNEKIEQFNINLKLALEEREKDYQNACNLYSHKPWEMTINQMYKLFERLGTYKDSDRIRSEIKKILDEKEIKRQELREMQYKKSEIYNQYSNLGTLNVLKRKDLNEQLKQINSKLAQEEAAFVKMYGEGP